MHQKLTYTDALYHPETIRSSQERPTGEESSDSQSMNAEFLVSLANASSVNQAVVTDWETRDGCVYKYVKIYEKG